MTKKHNNIGQETLLLLNADPEESAGISFLLVEAGFLAHSVASVSELKEKLKSASFMAVIIDLDSVAVDNRTMRELATQLPDTPFLCLSKERFHPELKDSIRDHIYACLTKPIDPDELGYWLKCIRKDDRSLTVG
jgi:DNA-binding NtrC family response regulator